LLFVIKAAYTIVDELCEFSPTMTEDNFFHRMDVDIPYTKESRKYKVSYGEGSATKAYVLFLNLLKPVTVTAKPDSLVTYSSMCTCHCTIVFLTYLKVETGSGYPGNCKRVPGS